MPVKYIEVAKEDDGQRLDNYLIKTFKGVPKSRIYKSIRSGEVRINKKRCKAETRLTAGDELRLPPLRVAAQSEQVLPTHKWRMILENAVVHEDDNLLVLNKPAGIAVHGGSGLAFGLVELLQALKPAWQTVELVHRLDRETSGILLLAKKRSILKYLHEKLRLGEVEKRYQAIVKGYWLDAPRTISLPLLRYQMPNGERMVKVSEEGKTAATIFTPVQHVGHRLTVVEAELLTGRTHQIRVHAKSCGHPIVGDQKYGDTQLNAEAKAAGFAGMFLHAKYVRVRLPEGELVLEAKVPKAFELFLEAQA